ncbi:MULTISPECIES: methyl-accepting chemotaxis protein [unclassified Herbaspirillum]|uniref:methyl-accepting chemotaxis protein n=1 Tax=unclassified Herbaspirillum TaxID=2624150 RepID=UPI000E2F196C|nr:MULTISPECIES: methyl-accepting chemotaxis protein [unclassified Herbaspirillum]RFB65824.1 HAMP domain-containing protein [Herbaspirillum sp. 3R-3a1]TFI08867.1 HAMP domain-containing protein [Herbaspirillum sp. 3R11]TFI15284.1 HAMP domain-containing protein [Herbaspirillum sp. 3R-11]TFI27829.1 HAMP domain-containing protein [Herbaspirillum sp. 3C11]
MKIANITISRRLWLGFGLLTLLMIAMAVVGVNRLAQLNRQMNDVIHDKYPKTVAAGDIVDQINLVARSLRNILLLKDATQIKSENDRIVGADKAIQERLAELDKRMVDDQSRTLLAGLITAQTNYVDKRDKVRKLVADGTRDGAIDMLISEVRPVQSAYMTAVDKLIRQQNEMMVTSGDEVERNYEHARNMLIVLAALGLVMAGGIAWGITRSITIPLNRAVAVARTVASGDLTSEIDSSGKDETAQLLEALKTMNDNLLKIVSQVRSGTDTIATASGEIASGNLDLSSRTEQQAGSLEETASAMEELTSTVRQNADNARQANELAASASEVATQGGNVVGQVVTTMESINASSRKIVDIISVIDGIAFQTNILALNAAVEAARAGEQGRGFAVVASEVRSLAQRSASAAKEIKTLINDSVEKVGNGSKLVAQAGNTMNEVVQSVRRVTEIVGEITVAGQEQSEGIEQINQAITQMDETTQQNAALVEQAAAAAQSLQDQADRLAQVVGVFKLGGYQLLGDDALVQRNVRPAAIAKPVLQRLGRTAQPAAMASGDKQWEEF